MKEQSHKNEMRAALRGDFERLRARRDDGGAQVAIAPPAAVPQQVRHAEPIVSEPLAVEPALEAKPERARFTWLDRLLERR